MAGGGCQPLGQRPCEATTGHRADTGDAALGVPAGGDRRPSAEVRVVVLGEHLGVDDVQALDPVRRRRSTTLRQVDACGFTSLVQLLVITFAGCAVYGAYTSVVNGWLPHRTGQTLSPVFLAAWILITVPGGWFMNVTDSVRPGSWGFPLYLTAMTAAIGFSIIALRAAGTREGRRHLDAGIWLIATLLAVLTLFYYGEFGPLATPRIADPYDLLVLLAISLAAYWWSQRSGFRPEQLDRAPTEDHPSAADQEPTGSPARPTLM